MLVGGFKSICWLSQKCDEHAYSQCLENKSSESWERRRWGSGMQIWMGCGVLSENSASVFLLALSLASVRWWGTSITGK